MRTDGFRSRPCARQWTRRHVGALVGWVVAFGAVWLPSPVSAAPIGTRSVLDNGAVLLVAERPGPPMVVLSMILKTGAAADPPDKHGVANLTAELVTRGTQRHTAHALAEALDFLGTSLSVNAGYDSTTVSLTTLTKNLDASFAILADVLLTPTFAPEEFERIRAEVEGRLHSREEDPGWVAGKVFKETLYPQHPYGRLVSGRADTLKRITPADMRRFHATYYRPNNAIVAAAGDIGRERLTELFSTHFSSWTPGDLPALTWPPEPDGQARQRHLHRPVTQATIVLGHRGIARSHPDYYAVLVMNHILGGGGFGSRLMDRIREDRGYVYGIDSYFSARKHPGPFTVSLQTRNGSARQALDETLAVIRQFIAEGPTEEELAAAKAFFVNSFPLRLVSNRDVAALLPLVEFYGLGLDYPDRYADLIGAVTRERAAAAAATYLDPDRFLRVVVADLDEAGLEPTPVSDD